MSFRKLVRVSRTSMSLTKSNSEQRQYRFRRLIRALHPKFRSPQISRQFFVQFTPGLEHNIYFSTELGILQRKLFFTPATEFNLIIGIMIDDQRSIDTDRCQAESSHSVTDRKAVYRDL